MGHEEPLSTDFDTTTKASAPMDARAELRQYAAKLEAEFERRKFSRAAGRHARYASPRVVYDR
jgi:hypothetical protein